MWQSQVENTPYSIYESQLIQVSTYQAIASMVFDCQPSKELSLKYNEKHKNLNLQYQEHTCNKEGGNRVTAIRQGMTFIMISYIWNLTGDGDRATETTCGHYIMQQHLYLVNMCTFCVNQMSTDMHKGHYLAQQLLHCTIVE